VQEQDRRVGAKSRADELVGRGGRGEEVGLVGSVERIGEDEPGTEGLVVGRLKTYVAGFECCGRNSENRRKVMSWSGSLSRIMGSGDSRARSYFSGVSYRMKRDALMLCMYMSLWPKRSVKKVTRQDESAHHERTVSA
jgi:hypothetical protein